MSKIESGSAWKLSKDFGTGNGHVPAGSEVAVVGVYPPGTPGLGASNEDLVLAKFARPGADPQNIAVPVSDFVKIAKAVA